MPGVAHAHHSASCSPERARSRASSAANQGRVPPAPDRAVPERADATLAGHPAANILRAGVESLTERQHARLDAAWAADDRHVEVELAWRCAQQVRSAYHQDTHAAGKAIAEKIIATLDSCPVPEVARLGKTLKTWRAEFLGYFDTNGASNGGTEAINGLIELHRRVARGFRNRDNYRLRMLLIGGGLRI